MRRILGLLLLSLSFAAASADLHMLTDNHPPLHFERNGEIVGFAVDVVRALAEQEGDNIRIEREPLLRALADGSSAANTGLFTILRTPERERRYLWVGPLMDVETAFYGRSDSSSQVRTLDEARAVPRIVVPRKWVAYAQLQALGFTNLYGVDSPEQMMRLLKLGRTDLIVTDTLTAATLAGEEGLPPDMLRYQMPLASQGSYIAFSLQTDWQVAARWQAALEAMRKDGRLQQLRQRWKLDQPLR
ncbi:transporter substrate-binding domain-containing protein [Pseudomonas sp. BN411]|uniref:substrate-binding periplasmic protein n=1 Tax=Pseudomonas sp. BN411 TaxID=2567887 RepID=UPI002458A8E9|nr:transporter substrate-binding domain-containing protein [Pseudomonas sp. BN411]MDH4564875.1 amino acid ABC transporter substrate-binding protein [Pseudomonas sp. BN411]